MLSHFPEKSIRKRRKANCQSLFQTLSIIVMIHIILQWRILSQQIFAITKVKSFNSQYLHAFFFFFVPFVTTLTIIILFFKVGVLFNDTVISLEIWFYRISFNYIVTNFCYLVINLFVLYKQSCLMYLISYCLNPTITLFGIHHSSGNGFLLYTNPPNAILFLRCRCILRRLNFISTKSKNFLKISHIAVLQ